MFQEKVRKIKESGFSLDVSEIIKNAYNIVVKKLLVKSIAFILLYLAVSFVVQYFAYVIAGVDIKEFFTTYIELIKTNDIERLTSFVESQKGAMNIASVLSGIFSLLLLPLLLGYVEMVKNMDLNGEASFSDIIKPYTSSKLVGIMVIHLAIMVLSAVGFALCVFPGIYIMTALSLAPMIYWFNKDVSFGEALSGSLKVVNSNFFGVLGTFIVLGLLSVAGMFLCGIGLFVTIPIGYAGYYFIYKSIFMQGESYSEIEEIGA